MFYICGIVNLLGDHMLCFEIEMLKYLCTRNLLFELNLTQSQDQVQRGFLLDVVVGQGTAIFQLFAGEDQTLLVRWDAFFVLDFGFDVFNGVAGFDVQRDGFAR